MRIWLPLLAAAALTACVGGDDDPGIEIIPDDNFEDADLMPDQVTDVHNQLGVPAVDVLWVVDNSLSMAEEQRALANNFTSFMDSFANSELDLDYHVGVVSTGYDDEEERGRLQVGIDPRGDEVAWIDPDTRDPEGVFRQMALLGTDGPYEEKGRAQVYTALEVLGDTQNFGFIRRDAYLSVIVRSDEDDRSGDTPIGEAEFIDWLRSFKETPEQVSFSSIVPPMEGCPAEQEEFGPAVSYLNVTDAVGGAVHPICEPSWATVLEELGLSAAGLREEFALSALPDLDEDITVRIKAPREPEYGAALGLDFTYNRQRNSLVWRTDPPPPNSRITITYTEVTY